MRKPQSLEERKERSKIDNAIAIQEQIIVKLKEYKATLINLAVTGKIKVPMPMQTTTQAVAGQGNKSMTDDSLIQIYQSPDGETCVDVRFERETVWLTQNKKRPGSNGGGTCCVNPVFENQILKIYVTAEALAAGPFNFIETNKHSKSFSGKLSNGGKDKNGRSFEGGEKKGGRSKRKNREQEMKKKKTALVPNNSFTEFLLYTTPNGKVKLDIFSRDKTIWLTQEKIGQLFGLQRPAITKYLKNIFESRELDEKMVSSIKAFAGNDDI